MYNFSNMFIHKLYPVVLQHSISGVLYVTIQGEALDLHRATSIQQTYMSKTAHPNYK